MIPLFIEIRFLDVIDILLVAFLLYQLYMLIRGTVAIRIFIGIFSIYIFWLFVKAMKMDLLASLLGQVIGVGVIALIIVFQQEVRKFLMMLGNRYFNRKRFNFYKLFTINNTTSRGHLDVIVESCFTMSKEKTGALIVIAKDSDLKSFTETGAMLNADINDRLIRNIFFKNSPLHDGALIVVGNKIAAAGCILPVSNHPGLADNYGLRHRAALGLTEMSDSLVIVVSEQTGNISVSKNGKLYPVTSSERLVKMIEKQFS
ncbi:MAG: diadenylate cyclase CdaA [Bacteroidales bacterium]|nr:diadenylate cyclase CdaA [Bacteroidales bacterium]HOY38608.1 diadenylate cyclase CdaA [Bacteroidales bacterium]HQP04507.1 diadenylate cyclase CdaA [Bacteroidales bacterium]